MASHLCPNATSNQTNYSAPVPIIGLYIAGASLVCLMLIINDMFHGYRSRKKWLPCRWFSLNSVSLTLLSIAAKLPVDLTTSMPSAQDQLSKLIGSAFICVCMGFFLPSVGSNRTPESWTNMAALTIFVMTVFGNICIQMTTGVIYAFIPEHVITMCFMLAMLILLWYSTWSINAQKETQMDLNRGIFTKGQRSPSMLERLKLCYLHGYNSDPQFVLCKSYYSAGASVVSFMCLIVVLQVTVRSSLIHGLRFCNGESDYGWSMRIIVLSQMLVILLASLATCFRVLFLSHWLTSPDTFEALFPKISFYVIVTNYPFLKAGRRYSLIFFFFGILEISLIVMAVALFVPVAVLLIIYSPMDKTIRSFSCSENKHREPEGMQHSRDVLDENNVKLKQETLRECMKDMNSLLCLSDKSNFMITLRQLLLMTNSSQRSNIINQIKSMEGNGISCLYLVYVVKIAGASLPSPFSVHLSQWLNEVFDTIHFVDTKLNSVRSDNKWKCTLAKALWMGDDFSNAHAGGKMIERPSETPQFNIASALGSIEQLSSALPCSFIWDEVRVIKDFIDNHVRDCTSIEELYERMVKLFVALLHELLSQLPRAIIKEVTECPVEEYEEKVRLMLKFLGQIQYLEDAIEWSFPDDFTIKTLLPSQTSAGDNDPNATEDEGHMININVPCGEITPVQ